MSSTRAQAQVEKTPDAPAGEPRPVERPTDERRPSAGGRALSVLAWLALRLYPIALLLVIWLLLVRYEVVGNAFVMPGPLAVWNSAVLAWQSGALQDAAATTLFRVVAAWGLAFVVGVTLGLLLGRLRAVRLAVRPLVSFFFPTPKVAIYPALVILFGLGSASKVALGFAEAVFPIVLATAAAASQIEPRLVWSARGLGTSQAAVLPRVVLPAALPGILTGARIGLVGAIIGVFIGELIVGADGLGHLMAASYRTLATAEMYVAVVLVSIIGFVLDRLFLLARSRLLVWSAEADH